MISSRVVEAITPLELSRASALFGVLKQVRVQLKTSDEYSLDKAFESHVHSVLEKLDQRLVSIDDTTIQKVEIIMAKHGLYDAVFQQVIAVCQNVLPSIVDSVRDLRKINSNLLSDLQQSFCETINQNILLVDENTKLRTDSSQVHMDISKLQPTLQLLNDENESLKEKILELRGHLREAEQSMNLLRSAVSEQDTPIRIPTNSSNSSSSSSSGVPITKPHSLGFERSTKDVFGEPAIAPHLQEMSITALQSTKSPSNNNYQGNNNNNNNNNNNSSMRSGNRGSGSSNPSTPVRSNGPGPSWDPSVLHSSWRSDVGSVAGSTGSNRSVTPSAIGSSSSQNRTQTPNRGRSNSGSASVVASNALNRSVTWSTLSVAMPLNWLLVFRADIQRVMDEGRCRDLTLKEVLDTIDSLYASKQVANEKAMRGVGNVPMETMEQHTFRTFEKKYGLRTLAAEHAGSLIKSLDTHAASDNTVQVFHKIFRNELEEDFRFIHAELSKTIKDLTMVQMMSRSNNNKDAEGIQAKVDQKIATGFIYEDEWKDMTNYLYNEADSSRLCTQLAKQAVTDSRERGETLFINATSTGIKSSLSASSINPVNQMNTSYVMGGGGSSASSASSSGGSSGVKRSSTPNKDSQRAKDTPGKDVKKLGYSSPTLSIHPRDLASPASKQRERLKLPFTIFFHIVLDFQLKCHHRYLNKFLQIFKDIDQDSDGMLNAAEFKEVFLSIRRSNAEEQRKKSINPFDATEYNEQDEMTRFLELLSIVDPQETDRITFSSAVHCLSKL